MIKCETSCCSDALERLVRAEYGFILDLFFFFPHKKLWEFSKISEISMINNENLSETLGML